MIPDNCIYISGAVSGLRRKEYMMRFREVEQIFLKRGYDVLNPTILWPSRWAWVYPLMQRIIGKRRAYRLTLAYDLKCLRRCKYIYMMWGSEYSIGARLERRKAREWGIIEVDS